jgi:hypothetical protein
MAKRKQDQIQGRDLWEWEVHYLINVKGIYPDTARLFVIARWAWNGDLRPLRAAIHQGHNEIVLDIVATMIAEGRLIVKKGRRSSPDKDARHIVAALLYENRTTAEKSEKAFAEIADILCMSHQSVRAAVTQWRKANAK